VKDVKVTHQAFSFTKMMREWSYPSPYWFEEHDLRPTGAIFHQTATFKLPSAGRNVIVYP